MSDKKNKQIIKRKSFKPLEWVSKSIFLNLKIYDDFTIVDSKLFFDKSRISKKGNILLNGNNLNTLKFKVIYVFKNKINKVKNLNPNSDYLVIKVPTDCVKLIIKSTVKLNPKINTSLEGFYESNHMFCTQCEPEGFRKITWFTDRPDNLSIFKVRIEAKNSYNNLLSNGNLVRSGNIKNYNRKYVIWNDPFPKPSYLFALVVGNLEVLKDYFITKDKKKVSLEIFTEMGQSRNARYAMESLKKAMKWDEDNYDLIYDLERFMIVAVSHFNMGAMENKGLNIFNSKFILSDENKTTDQDLKNIESIIAHEYFHNWTGNRVTCRDWFQLTFKEGLTVFRDQQFSSDMQNPIEKRIKDILFLRDFQFAEDQGPNRHSIRPDQYLEINNFYTATVYEKGAEFIRMLSNYIGEKKFKKSTNYFLKNYDGKAVTCEEFLDCIQKFSKTDVGKFSKWYDQKGIISLIVRRKYHKNQGLELIINQKNKFCRSVVPIPIKISFFDQEGNKIKFQLLNKYRDEHDLIIENKEEKIIFPEINHQVIPSLLRDYSAPVNLKTDLSVSENIHLLKFDDNLFKKWDICQNLHLSLLKKNNLKLFSNSIKQILNDKTIDNSIISLILTLPSYKTYQNTLSNYDPLDLYKLRNNYLIKFYKNFEDELYYLFKNSLEKFYTNNDLKIRSLLKVLLEALCALDNEFAKNIAENFCGSKIMEIKIMGLISSIKYNNSNSIKLLTKFYNEFKNDKIVLEKWFLIKSSYNNLYFDGINSIKDILKNKNFEYKNPNFVRAILGGFQNNNIELFHAKDNSGYKFVTDQIILIDKINPQTAARIITPMTNISKFNNNTKNRIKKYLNLILKSNPSTDVFEIISKSLN
ncbi:MAG: aminopeptidase N [Alphaproteobacteria bacterium]|nr:MAG: aminopeptidase N [Alphaproteobacteria bacterium]